MPPPLTTPLSAQSRARALLHAPAPPERQQNHRPSLTTICSPSHQGVLDDLVGRPLFLALKDYFAKAGGVYKLAFGPKTFMVLSDPVVVRVREYTMGEPPAGVLSVVVQPGLCGATHRGGRLLKLQPFVRRSTSSATPISASIRASWLRSSSPSWVSDRAPASEQHSLRPLTILSPLSALPPDRSSCGSVGSSAACVRRPSTRQSACNRCVTACGITLPRRQGPHPRRLRDVEDPPPRHRAGLPPGLAEPHGASLEKKDLELTLLCAVLVSLRVLVAQLRGA